MIILLGSESAQKIGILRDALEVLSGPDFEIMPFAVPSGISEQPLDLETTRRGALNRAARAAEAFGRPYDFSFGLEAGLEMVEGLYYFVSVAALLRSDGRMSVGVSTLIPLPGDTSERVLRGEHLSDIIWQYRDRTGLSSKEVEAVEDLISRRKGFTEAINKAWGNTDGE
jgi:non-canonical (house-cleaning) NTP pyrophosphatase